jgi:hypothetical protein
VLGHREHMGWRSVRQLILVCALVAGGILALGASAASAKSQPFYVIYKGDYAWHQDWEGGGTSAGSSLRTDETLSWVLTVTGTVHSHGQPTARAKLVEQGSIHQHGTNPAPANDDCTVHQLPGAGAQDFHVERAGPNKINVSVGIPTDAMVSGCPDFKADQVPIFCSVETCAGATVCGSVPPVWKTPKFGDAYLPSLSDVDSGTHPFDVSGPTASEKVHCSFGGTESTKVLINSTVSVNEGPGAVKHKPGKPHIPEIERQKVFATSDLLTSILRAEASCGQTVAGVLANVWGTTVASGGVAAVLTGAIILAGSAPTCLALLNRAFDDIDIIDDPPRNDIYAVAVPARIRRSRLTLPSCAGRSGSVRTFCTKLRADERAYVTAVQHATAVDAALLTTVDRESGAARKHKKAALALQERTGSRLVGQLKSASSAERAIGRKLIALLHSHKVFGRLTAAQDGAAIAYVKSKLARRGIHASQLPKRALRAGSVNLVSVFGG